MNPNTPTSILPSFLTLLLSLPVILDAFPSSGRCRNGDVTIFAQPRRTLPKRPRKKNKWMDSSSSQISSSSSSSLLKKNAKGKGMDFYEDDEDFWNNSESRPIISAASVLAGEDYWIDEKELEKELKREKAIANRKAMEGEIPQEKLKQEIAAPYKQNWIGFISVGVVVLAVIGSQFPELLQIPVIPNVPDTI